MIRVFAYTKSEARTKLKKILGCLPVGAVIIKEKS